MLFNSYIFIFLFLPLVLTGYYGLCYIKQEKMSLVYLIGMSMWFYGYNSIHYLCMLIISILMNYMIVEIMSHMTHKVFRRCMLAAGLIWNLGVLFYFKYYDFFIENVNAVWKTDFTMLHLMLPLGISFYTFQQLSYVIDSYRQESEKYSLLEYAAYVSFFPQLIAGPIVYHDEFIPEIRKPENRKIRYENLSKGIYAFALGLAKKVLIADTFSPIVTIGYGAVNELNTPSALLVMVCYSLQIYFDFSGYCDMAYGIGYMFNVKLPENFNSPYKADSITDFWDRWHMTLTRFFTKYIYIPLGGSRRGEIRRYVNIMVVFLVSGLWHGANWTFIVWGALNGVCNVLDKLFGKAYRMIPKWIRIGINFIFATFAWSLFRADSIETARQLWHQLVTGGWGSIYTPIAESFYDLTEMRFLYRVGLAPLINQYPAALIAGFTTIFVLICFTLRNTQEKAAKMQMNNRRIAVIVICMTWSIVSLSQVSEFLYFNF